MKVLLISCLLFASALAQTDYPSRFEEFAYKHFAEIPIAGLEKIERNYPAVAELCSRKEKVLLEDSLPPAEIQFLEGINGGTISSVVKISTSGEEMAFKIFSVPGTANEEEIEIMQYLTANGMTNVPRLRLGEEMHHFAINGHEYDGFAMELIPYPTLFIAFGQQAMEIEKDQRLSFLLSDPIKAIYRNCLAALTRMWSLCVVHRDLHPHNILVDIDSGDVKIIDFGKASFCRRGEKTELEYRIAVRDDFKRFVTSFVIPILKPELTKKGDRSLVYLDGEVKHAMKMLDPNVNLFDQSGFPDTPEFQAVWDGFRKIHGVLNSQDYDEDHANLIQGIENLQYQSPEVQTRERSQPGSAVRQLNFEMTPGSSSTHSQTPGMVTLEDSYITQEAASPFSPFSSPSNDQTVGNSYTTRSRQLDPATKYTSTIFDSESILICLTMLILISLFWKCSSFCSAKKDSNVASLLEEDVI